MWSAPVPLRRLSHHLWSLILTRLRCSVPRCCNEAQASQSGGQRADRKKQARREEGARADTAQTPRQAIDIRKTVQRMPELPCASGRSMLKRAAPLLGRRLRHAPARIPFACRATATASTGNSLLGADSGKGCAWAPDVAPATHRPPPEQLAEALLVNSRIPALVARGICRCFRHSFVLGVLPSMTSPHTPFPATSPRPSCASPSRP